MEIISTKYLGDPNSKSSNKLFNSVYILVRIEINTKSETLSVVHTYEFKNNKII